MSIKRQIQSHYKNLLNSIHSIELPAWLTSLPLRVGLAMIVVMLSLAYVTQVSDAATTGYQINDLEKRVSNLSEEIQGLEIKVAYNSTLSSIQTRLSSTNMIAVTKVNYLSVSGAAMARR